MNAIARLLMNLSNDRNKLEEGRRENILPKTTRNLGQVIGYGGSAAAAAGALYLLIKAGADLFSKPMPRTPGKINHKHHN